MSGRVALRGSGWLASLARWFDSGANDGRDDSRLPRSIDWLRVLPFVLLHASCLLVLAVGWSWTALAAAVASYGVRMFAVTAFYHRYFSHRAFRTSRALQFGFALLGSTAVQRGPLWWAAHHRAHHRHSDREGDVHSPQRDGLWWSHLGWLLARENYRTRLELVGDLACYPELRFLDRFDSLVPLLMLPFFWVLGELLQSAGLSTSGPQLLVWGFSIATVVLYHVTFSINSMAHRIGSQRYETRDESRNNPLLAVLALGEGWHNNHHRYPAAARQGFHWWQIDATYLALRAMACLGLVRDLRQVPENVRSERWRR